MHRRAHHGVYAIIPYTQSNDELRCRARVWWCAILDGLLVDNSLIRESCHLYKPFPLVRVGRVATRAEDAQGTPTQNHISPSVLAYEENLWHLQVGASVD